MALGKSQITKSRGRFTIEILEERKLFHGDHLELATIQNSDRDAIQFTAPAMLSASNDGDATGDVPVLHSNPRAKHTIFLDFDGHNEADVKAMNFSGDEAAFDSSEQRLIRDIHARVAEDFSPFDVNVTTEEPSTEGDGSDKRVVVAAIGEVEGFTGAWGCMGCADDVAIIYSNLIGDHPAQIANVISHEVGHALGLRHQADFEDGNLFRMDAYGKGEDDWTPIMGAPQIDRTTWIVGTNSSWKSQDDLAIIAESLGYRTDDHANSVERSTSLAPDGCVQSISGVIENTSDVDYFRLRHDGGRFHATLDVLQSEYPGVAANLDGKLELLDQFGSEIIATSAPTARLNAYLLLELEAGVYILRVSGDNVPGAVGQYTLTVGGTPLNGDFDGDGAIDQNDIDLLFEQMKSETPDRLFDLTEDGRVDEQDRDHLILDTLNRPYGDSNLDGGFDIRDLILTFQSGRYEVVDARRTAWSDGDWNGDGRFDSSDLVLAGQLASSLPDTAALEWLFSNSRV